MEKREKREKRESRLREESIPNVLEMEGVGSLASCLFSSANQDKMLAKVKADVDQQYKRLSGDERESV